MIVFVVVVVGSVLGIVCVCEEEEERRRWEVGRVK
jgi:hypothetical protein